MPRGFILSALVCRVILRNYLVVGPWWWKDVVQMCCRVVKTHFPIGLSARLVPNFPPNKRCQQCLPLG